MKIKFKGNNNVRGTIYTDGQTLETDDEDLQKEVLMWCKCEEVTESGKPKEQPKPPTTLTTESMKPKRARSK